MFFEGMTRSPSFSTKMKLPASSSGTRCGGVGRSHCVADVTCGSPRLDRFLFWLHIHVARNAVCTVVMTNAEFTRHAVLEGFRKCAAYCEGNDAKTRRAGIVNRAAACLVVEIGARACRVGQLHPVAGHKPGQLLQVHVKNQQSSQAVEYLKEIGEARDLVQVGKVIPIARGPPTGAQAQVLCDCRKAPGALDLGHQRMLAGLPQGGLRRHVLQLHMRLRKGLQVFEYGAHMGRSFSEAELYV